MLVIRLTLPHLRRVLELLGASRHSALPTVRDRVAPVARPVVVRVIALLFGCTLIGAAVALLVQADLGLAPYDVLTSGIADIVGLSLGQAGWLLAAAFFAVAAVLGQRASIWGIAYMLGNGVAIDATDHLLNPPTTELGRWAFMFSGILVMAIGISLILFSGTTGGPFELLMRAGEKRGIKPLITRYGLDVGVLVGGIAIGGQFGWGTLLYAAMMGPCLAAISQVMADFDTGRRLRIEAARTRVHVHS